MAAKRGKPIGYRTSNECNSLIVAEHWDWNLAKRYCGPPQAVLCCGAQVRYIEASL